jgi:hypothetical protein
MKYPSIAGVCVAVFLIGIAVFFYTLDHSVPTANTYQRTVALWQERFRTQGITRAYAQFVREGNTLPPNQSHTLAHIVGAILFDSKGLSGLAYCTADFNYGCYHGFAGRVIEQNGIGGIQMLLDTCAGQSVIGDCEHGIGHGILAYLGDDKLTEALRLCPLPGGAGTGGCYNGVFMEYFLDTLRSDQGGQPLRFEPSQPEGPCKTMPAQFQPACYYELPSWWRVLRVYQGADYTGQFTSVGEHCEEVTDAALREICFSGAGAQIAPATRFDLARAKELCSLMPEDGRTACLNEAMNSISSFSSVHTANTAP